MSLIPNVHRKPITLRERKPSENPRVYRPPFSEKGFTALTLGLSLKMAPLRRSWFLACSEELPPPREAQLRPAPRRSTLSKETSRRSALAKDAPYRVAPSRFTPRRLAPRRSAQLRSASRKSASWRLAPRRSAQHM